MNPIAQPLTPISQNKNTANYRGFGLIGLGLVLELSSLPLAAYFQEIHAPPILSSLTFIAFLLLGGMALCVLGIANYAKAKGHNWGWRALWCLLACVPVIGPLSLLLGIFFAQLSKAWEPVTISAIGILGTLFLAYPFVEGAFFSDPPCHARRSEGLVGLGSLRTIQNAIHMRHGRFAKTTKELKDLGEYGGPSSRTRYTFFLSPDENYLPVNSRDEREKVVVLPPKSNAFVTNDTFRIVAATNIPHRPRGSVFWTVWKRPVYQLDVVSIDEKDNLTIEVDGCNEHH